jgi:hypothetical protein
MVGAPTPAAAQGLLHGSGHDEETGRREGTEGKGGGEGGRSKGRRRPCLPVVLPVLFGEVQPVFKVASIPQHLNGGLDLKVNLPRGRLSPAPTRCWPTTSARARPCGPSAAARCCTRTSTCGDRANAGMHTTHNHHVVGHRGWSRAKRDHTPQTQHAPAGAPAAAATVVSCFSPRINLWGCGSVCQAGGGGKGTACPNDHRLVCKGGGGGGDYTPTHPSQNPVYLRSLSSSFSFV